jgi:hypothetical protein
LAAINQRPPWNMFALTLVKAGMCEAYYLGMKVAH